MTLSHYTLALWTVLMIALGFIARDYATRDVHKIEQMHIMEIWND